MIGPVEDRALQWDGRVRSPNARTELSRFFIGWKRFLAGDIMHLHGENNEGERMKIFSRKWWLVIIPVLILGLGWACGGSNGASSLNAPFNLQSTVVSSTQINLTWTDNSDDEDGFKIERKTGADGIWEYLGSVTANVVSCSDFGLISNTTYYYRVYAYNSAGNSGYSNEASVATSTCPLIVPTAPSNLTSIVVSSTEINLSWTDNSNKEDGFAIERKIGSGGTYAQAGTVGVGVTSYQDSGLDCDTEYYYRINAFSCAGSSGYSNEVNATTSICPVNAPTAPSGLTAAVVLSSQINLYWTDNSNNESGFKIERKTESGKVYSLIATTSANVTYYSVTGLSAGTYYYRVYAYNSAGSSGYSNEVKASNTGSWTPTSTGTNVPSERVDHTAVWTGTEMIVWGGDDSFSSLNTGGRYNPSTDSWIATSTGTNVPSGRWGHTAVWTGTEMIIWGGANINSGLNTGGRYNPSTDSWISTSTGANVPIGANWGPGNSAYTAVWTGAEMIVWSGSGSNIGGKYNPLTDSWTATSTGTNVPSGGVGHTAVWTGTEMIVWGHSSNIGGKYNPLTDSWTTTSTGANVPSVRSHHTAVWTGTEMIIWGGNEGSIYVDTGGRYNPSTDSWVATAATGTNGNSPRYKHTAVWTGTEMIVWGGVDNSSHSLNTGGKYNPLTDSWTPTSTGANVPSTRQGHTAVWTGTEMIVWGSGSVRNTGGRYTP